MLPLPRGSEQRSLSVHRILNDIEHVTVQTDQIGGVCRSWMHQECPHDGVQFNCRGGHKHGNGREDSVKGLCHHHRPKPRHSL